jgi:hypothetical protein
VGEPNTEGKYPIKTINFNNDLKEGIETEQTIDKVAYSLIKGKFFKDSLVK